MPKASDFSKRLRAKHLGGESRVLTIGQVGVEKMQKRAKPDLTIFAAEGMENPNDLKTEQVVYLWFRELGATRSMRVNETNLDALIAARGEDFKDWINCRVTLTPEEIFAFGKKQDTIVITKVVAPQAKSIPANVDPATGEVREQGTKDPATLYWKLAEEWKLKREASAVLKAHTNAEKVIDWNGATAELRGLAQPTLAEPV